MGKRKRNNAHANAVKRSTTTGIPSPPNETDKAYSSLNIETVVPAEDLEIAAETLEALSQHPSLIKSKACKDLRTAVYNFRQASTTGMIAAEKSNLTARISAALTDGKYTDALILLAEMRIRKEMPTLGALCRWVRTLDVISGLSIHVQVPDNTISGRNAHNEMLIQVLDAVLRVTGPLDISSNGTSASSEPIALQNTWILKEANEPTLQTRQSVVDKTILSNCAPGLKNQFRAIETTPGPDRKPPNFYPAILYASKDDSVLLGKGPEIQYHEHPIVPNLRLLKDVLSPEECTSIIAAAETMEFIPDAPIRPQEEDTSILAHNFYWIIDQAFHDKLWNRVKGFIPDVLAGKKARGINRRFRVYRYVPGAEYRCHIDGAWPPSGIDPATDTYQYDSSPPNARQSSLFTFLMYLNDDFKGGETTFFVPSVREGVINAYPVRPIMGSVAIFPHGEAEGALLHEGTGVVEGAKYIIRTDVEYDVDRTV